MKTKRLQWSSRGGAALAVAWLCAAGALAQVLSPNPNYHVQALNNLYQVNPAMAGSNNQLTGFLTYHQQVLGGFDDAPRHVSLSADAPFTRSQEVAFGFNMYSFRRSILQSTGLSGTFARKLVLGKKWHTLRLGVTAGFYHNSINPDGVNLADPAIVRLNGKLQPDVAFGLHYQLKGFQFGVSFPKLLAFATPGADGAGPPLRVRPFSSQSVYFLYDLELTARWSVRPMLLYRSLDNAFSGLEFSTRVQYDDRFWLGGTMRQQFGTAAFAGFKVRKLSVGYAYKLPNAQAHGFANPAHEVQLGLYLGRLGKSTKLAGRGGARLKTNDTFVAGGVRKSKSALPDKKAAQAKGTLAAGQPAKSLPAGNDRPAAPKAGKLKVETVRKGESADDLPAGNYLVLKAFADEAAAKKEAHLVKRNAPKGVELEPEVGFQSEKQLYYVYLGKGDMEAVMEQGTALKKKKGFEKIAVLKISNRPHGESLD